MKCDNCGSEYVKITMWDGPESGGELIVCDQCGRVLKCRQHNQYTIGDIQWDY